MLIYRFKCMNCGNVQEELVNSAGSVNMFQCRKCGSADLVMVVIRSPADALPGHSPGCGSGDTDLPDRMSGIAFRSIGIIHTPFRSLKNMPIQSGHAPGIEGTVEVFGEFAEGLEALKGFSHIQLLYYFHRSKGYRLKVVPFLDTVKRGVFATRAPRRPNQIGLSVTELIGIERNIIHIKGVDILDGTPLIDIKPYIPFFDEPDREVRIGWLTGKKHTAPSAKSDLRFSTHSAQVFAGGEIGKKCG
ncbi:tRNA (N6-threonylcarbamoyladenosine(37)-N6)-methyltransferase TrmO [candidate division KSB1 bacterium]